MKTKNRIQFLGDLIWKITYKLKQNTAVYTNIIGGVTQYEKPQKLSW